MILYISRAEGDKFVVYGMEKLDDGFCYPRMVRLKSDYSEEMGEKFAMDSDMIFDSHEEAYAAREFIERELSYSQIEWVGFLDEDKEN